jgi:hypothetical protein
MHHQTGIFISSSWFWPTLIIIGLLALGFIVYIVSKRKGKSDTPSLTYKEEMAEIYCPELLSEVVQLRTEVKKLKGITT